jgi:hydrogenase maturation protease
MTSGERAPLVIGVGNRDRGDDGIGPAVVDELRRRRIPLPTIVREGDLADLAVLWRAHPDVLIVDACRTGHPVGTVRRLDPTDAGAGLAWSTHGIGVADAIELARRLGRLPERLRLVGVEGQRFEIGPMSDALAVEMAHVVDEIEVMARSGCC